MTPSKHIFQMVLPPDLAERVDDFRFENRFPSRAAAIRWMVEKILDLEISPKDSKGEGGNYE